MQTLKHSITKIKSSLGDAGILMISSLLVNAGNYALNLCLGRWLGPEVFAEANILATLVMILSFIAVGLQLTVAKYAATFYAENQKEKLQDLISVFLKTGKRFGLYLLPILLLLAPFVKNYLLFKSILPILILFLGVPLYLLFSISRGYFQGTNQFKKLAFTYVIEMITRVIVTIGFIYLFQDSEYLSAFVALGFQISFITTFLFSRLKTSSSVSQLPYKKEIISFMAVIGIYELSQILINNSDVILVKHFFTPKEAGLYAAIALIGRIVFFATWTIVTLLFPKVIEKEKRGESHTHLFWGALGLVSIIGFSIVGCCYFFDHTIITILFGEAYLSMSHLLWIYALATCLFACANVFAYYHMSLNNYIPVFLCLSIGVLQIISIYLFHNSIEQLIGLQVFLMSLLLAGMMCYHSIVLRTFTPLTLITE